MARTVLLADDSVTAQNMGRRILIDAGYEVITVNNGSAALKKIHESRPDLIVLDVYMPGYGGLEVCQRLKEASETARIPILLTVGKMEPFKAEEARKARADGHIVKPFDAGELLAALAKLEDRIVPQPEPSRGRKSKTEKKSRSWQVADPAMSFDDTNTDKIAYLTQVKQRHRNEPEDNGNEAHAAENASAETRSIEAAEPVETSSTRLKEGPKMPRPMSVYAAEQLQELPVVAEAPRSDSQDVAAQQEPSVSDTARPEPTSESAEAKGVSSEAPAVSSEVPAVTPEESLPASAAPEAASVSEPQVEESSISSEQPQPAPVSTAGPEESIPAQSEAQLTPQPEVAAEPVPRVAVSRWTAENVALSPEEASLELEREMQEAQAHTDTPAVEGPAAQELPAEPVQPESPEADERDGATFAAAAAASSGTSAVATTEVPAEPAVAPESAAAWENWRHIRDSVMGVQSAVAESVAQIAESSPAPSPSQDAQGPSEADAEAADLSSIVDSVLAELKPKLMAEISKKLKK